MTTEGKKMRQSSGDIISNLPRDAIDNILTCLSLRDAVRTRILSRRWRYMWAHLPYIVFDYDTFPESSDKTHEELLIAIHEVLLLNHGPIVKFVLSLPGLKSCRQIDPLVTSVSRNSSLKEFTLHILQGAEPYKLPSSLFSCVELTRLCLKLCVIEPPIQFKGFNCLIFMEISQCSILPDVLSGLISSCPLLEELKVTSTIPVRGHIEVSAPNLRDLNFTGQFSSIFFKYIPLLSSCVLLLPEGVAPPEGESSNACESFHNLVAVEHLKIDFYYAGYKEEDKNSIPRKLPNPLNNLKTLTVGLISFRILYEVSLVLCLIGSSPELTKVVLHNIHTVGTDVDLEKITQLLQVQEWSGESLKSLREVEVSNITGKAPELGFIELLLAISPNLEKMTISPKASLPLQERYEILTKITRLRRSSSLSEIIYK